MGEDLKDRYLTAGISTVEHYDVIRSGMDLDQFQAAAAMSAAQKAEVRRTLGVPADVPLVGMVARLEERKGYRYFIEMAEKVLKQVPTAHFVGVGAGEQLDFLNAEVARRGLTGRVHFPGFRPDIAEVLACLDVTVLTSLWEGLPRVLVQAAACSVPAVTFEVEGAREVVKDGVNGYVVASKDVERLAERVISLLSDREGPARWASPGSGLVHQGWTIESMVREITEVYEALAAKNGGATGTAHPTPETARPW